MDKFVIHGGKELNGGVKINGAKNASLALMPATLLTAGKSILYNTPELNDVYTMLKLLNYLGVKSEFTDHTLELDTSNITSQDAPYEHVKKMRASVYVLGPLLARYGKAKVSLPGGCAWGPRPINLHLEGLKKMGADIDLSEGYIIASAKKLKGTKINFDISSVGATGNLLMAATLAEGTTVITNAAKEPEITNLANYLLKMGAKIDGVGTSVLTVEGVDQLFHSEIETIPDRIEAGTILIAVALSGGKVKISGILPEYFETVLLKLEGSGCKILKDNNIIELSASKTSINPTDIVTSIFPGYPTDMQAQWIAYMSQAEGISKITD